MITGYEDQNAGGGAGKAGAIAQGAQSGGIWGALLGLLTSSNKQAGNLMNAAKSTGGLASLGGKSESMAGAMSGGGFDNPMENPENPNRFNYADTLGMTDSWNNQGSDPFGAMRRRMSRG